VVALQGQVIMVQIVGMVQTVVSAGPMISPVLGDGMLEAAVVVATVQNEQAMDLQVGAAATELLHATPLAHIQMKLIPLLPVVVQ
jgi:hypothetical protein